MQTPSTVSSDLPAMLPALLAMPRAEKLRLIEALASDLARHDEMDVFDKNMTYEFWSPHDSYQAADQLLEMLKQHKQIGAVA